MLSSLITAHDVNHTKEYDGKKEVSGAQKRFFFLKKVGMKTLKGGKFPLRIGSSQIRMNKIMEMIVETDRERLEMLIVMASMQTLAVKHAGRLAINKQQSAETKQYGRTVFKSAAAPAMTTSERQDYWLGRVRPQHFILMAPIYKLYQLSVTGKQDRPPVNRAHPVSLINNIKYINIKYIICYIKYIDVT